MNDQDKITELKILAKAYKKANEYEAVPYEGEEGYDPEVKDYQGYSSYDITDLIVEIIEE